MISAHEATVRYRESLEKMRGDVEAQQLLADLIHIGKEISDNMNNPDSQKTYGSAELEILNRKLEDNLLVKEHLLAQRSYLDLITKIQERIKIPVERE